MSVELCFPSRWAADKVLKLLKREGITASSRWSPNDRAFVIKIDEKDEQKAYKILLKVMRPRHRRLAVEFERFQEKMRRAGQEEQT